MYPSTPASCVFGYLFGAKRRVTQMESCLRANNIDPGSARSIFETIRCVVAQWNSKRVSSSDQSMEKKADKKRRSKKEVVEEPQQVVPTENSEPHTTKVSVVKNEPVQIKPSQDMSMDVEECCNTAKKKRAQAAPSDSGSGKRRKTEKSKSPSPDSVEHPPANAKKASKRKENKKEDKKEDGNVVESVAGPSGTSAAQSAPPSVAAPATAPPAPPLPPTPPALPSRKLVLNKVQEGILADFEIIDPRRVTADESSSKKKKFASTSFLTLALRMLVDKSLITNEGLLLKSNVFVKPNVLSGFSVHVYGADAQTRVVYSGSLFDSTREGFGVYVHNLGPSRQINAGEVIAFLEIRSDDDRLKISY